jgi:hypothetical protein
MSNAVVSLKIVTHLQDWMNEIAKPLLLAGSVHVVLELQRRTWTVGRLLRLGEVLRWDLTEPDAG